MNAIVPVAFLFRAAIPCQRLAGGPGKARRIGRLSRSHRIPHLASVDGFEPFADVRVGWNDAGIEIEVSVTGKSSPPQCDAAKPTDCDGLQVWIDTRDTRDIHRASRFCHHFWFLPRGGGSGGRDAVAGQLPIHRARENAPHAANRLVVSARIRDDGYHLAATIPAEALHGFDPAVNRRLGFHYLIRDAELGAQFLTLADPFPIDEDPSLWSVLELVDA